MRTFDHQLCEQDNVAQDNCPHQASLKWERPGIPIWLANSRYMRLLKERRLHMFSENQTDQASRRLCILVQRSSGLNLIDRPPQRRTSRHHLMATRRLDTPEVTVALTPQLGHDGSRQLPCTCFPDKAKCSRTSSSCAQDVPTRGHPKRRQRSPPGLDLANASQSHKR